MYFGSKRFVTTKLRHFQWNLDSKKYKKQIYKVKDYVNEWQYFVKSIVQELNVVFPNVCLVLCMFSIHL